ncbi:hypothetical protein [Kitasatospora sp. CB01950]|uniref:hypothetical protein n=1 Tax=Kitasatospora sp. CB01950 TaxID=1703930 RepID=UPI00093FCF59|nr:hypothetical protein [Kitasatospora sp. CB01950]OKJ03383.1 hypothetical protein AMK19_27300 [Kitasatospora sp. CB01950]
MRAVKRVLAIGALAAPLVIGCAGLASATEEPSAHFVSGHFAANEDVAAEAFVASFVSPDCVEHIKGEVAATDEGVVGGVTEDGAHF